MRKVLRKRKPPNFWSSVENQRHYLDDLAQVLGLKSVKDYLHLRVGIIKSHGGTPLLNKYPSFVNALQKLYPEHNWNVWERKQVPRNFWQRSIGSHKDFFETLSSTLSIQSIHQWKSITHEKIIANKGRAILTYYSSLQTALQTIYPDKAWDEVFNSQEDSCRKTIEDIAKKLGCRSLDNLWEISEEDFRTVGGGVILDRYPCLKDALQILYPEKSQLQKPLLKKLPNGFWSTEENCQRFLNSLQSNLQINLPEDWTKLTNREIRKFPGGASFLAHFGGLRKMLCYFYPLIPSGRKKGIAKNYWQNCENVKKFLDSLKEQLQIRTVDDWTRVGRRQLIFYGALGALSQYGTLFSMLKIAYPETQFPPESVFRQRTKRSSQLQLYWELVKIFPDSEVVEEFWCDDPLNKGTVLQFDVFLPEFKMAFEYHGEHHYKDLPAFGHLDMYKFRDEEKRLRCSQLGICLVIVPYWWDFTSASLRGYIVATKPSINFFFANEIEMK